MTAITSILALRPSQLLVAATALIWFCSEALAQAPAAETPPPRSGRPEQRIERIHTEDEGAHINEVRVGGQTQSITVTPKANVPEYEIAPTEGARTPPTQREGSESGSGARVWNVLKF